MKKLLGFIVKLIVSLVFAVLIYLWSNYDIIATVLSFFIGTILIDFIGNVVFSNLCLSGAKRLLYRADSVTSNASESTSPNRAHPTECIM